MLKRFRYTALIYKILFFLNTLFYANNAFANNGNLRFNHFSDKEGLPHNYTFAVTQDFKGFIWIGTNNGLARFDGYSFDIYRPDPQRPNSISYKPVNSLYCDKKGNLWINFRGIGVNKMNLETGKFTLFLPDTSNPYSISGNQVRKYFETHDSVLYIATDKGIDCYNPSNQSFNQILPRTINRSSRPSNNVYDFFIDRSGFFWFQSTRGIGRLNLSDSSVKSLGTILTQPDFDQLTVNSIRYDNDNIIWIGTKEEGLFYYMISNNRLIKYHTGRQNIIKIYSDKKGNIYAYADDPSYSLIFIPHEKIKEGLCQIFQIGSNKSVTSVGFAEDRSGNIWFSSAQGLFMYRPESGITVYKSNPYSINALKDDNIVSMFIDNTENLWVCIYRQGLAKADLKQKPFRWHMPDLLDNQGSLAGNNVTAITNDKQGNLWVGCYGNGLTIYNRSTDKYLNASPFTKKMPKEFPITYLFQDNEGFIWVGYYDSQLNRINPATSEVMHYSPDYPENHKNYFKGRGVRKIISDSLGNIWFASMIGLIEYKPKTGAFIYHTSDYETNDDLKIFYRTVHPGENGIIWAGSNNGGLIRYDQNKKQFTHYLNNPSNPYSISSNTVYYIYQDEDKKLWIGTSAGLNLFDPVSEKFIQKGLKDRLNLYSILSIFPDQEDNFWMSTDNGLVKYNRKKDICTFYYESDGLPGNEFNTTAYLQYNDGSIYYGSPKGMISFKPSEISYNPYNAKPVITRLLIFNKNISPGDSVNTRVILEKQIWATPEIVLSNRENDFVLEFSALHYAVPEKNKFIYLLEGFNKEWITTDARRHSATFTGLPPGQYTFRLRATNNDGKMCDPKDEAILNIKILPPFYKTFGFKISLILITSIIIVLYIRIRMINLHRLNALLEKRVDERTSELKKANQLLEEKQEEINLQNEELMTQRDKLEETNKKLKEQQDKIIKQNIELDKHRNELEKLVDERTAELIKAKIKAEESDKLKSAFLANMSHEIRTPMNAILGFSSLLLDKSLSEKEKEEYINHIISNGESLLVLINDILDLSKIQAMQLPINKEPVDLSILFKELYNNFLLSAKNKGIHFSYLQPQINYYVEADYYRLKQVFSNLLSNAFKFTRQGEICFGISEINSEKILFFVKDTGIGIPPETGNLIFERFLKVNNIKEQIYSGIGLGLSICKNLTELWGGEIYYNSLPGQGTTFYFTIKNVRSTKKRLISEIQPEEEKYNFEDKIILIAEDNEDNFKFLSSVLIKTKALIAWVKDGKNAIDYMKDHPVDIILMDIKMPVKDGIEATQQIKKLYPDVPIIAQTAHAYDNERENYMQIGFDAYLTKPIEKTKLMQTLQKFLKKK